MTAGNVHPGTVTRITTDQQRAHIAAMIRLAAERSKQEVAILESHATRDAGTHSVFQQQRDRAIAEFTREHAKLVDAYKELREKVFSEYETEGFAFVKEEERCVQESSRKQAEMVTASQGECRKRCQEIQEAAEKQEAAVQQSRGQHRDQSERNEAELQALADEARKVVRKRCPWPEDAALATTPVPGDLTQQAYVERMTAAFGRANERLFALRHQSAAKFLEDGWPLLIAVFSVIAAAYPFWLLLGHFGIGAAVGACALLGLTLMLTIRKIVRGIAKRQTLQVVPQFLAEIEQARAESTAAQQAFNALAFRRRQEVLDRRDREIAAAIGAADRVAAAQAEQSAAHVRKVATQLRERRAALEESYEQKIQQLETQYPQKIRDFERDFEVRMADILRAYRERQESNRQQHQQEWQELKSTWTDRVSEFQAQVAVMNEYCAAHFRQWGEFDAATWQPPLNYRPANPAENEEGQPGVNVSSLCIGHYDFDMGSIAGGVPQAAELALPQTKYDLPVVISYPEKPSLLLKADGEGRELATRCLQNVMLRLLTTFPPGKVRFTIIDPVGLGQNFSAFMHLADYDERLVCNRIWTESTHIAQRLADLTEHMENVIQKYLRNEFPSILEYNQHAGEVAEPFQILVIANFPANFSDEAVRRLVSIANSGPRCGVYTLISTDVKLKLPRNMEMADLEANATTLVWDDETKRFCWNDDELRRWPLTLEMPPDDDRFTAIIRAVGARAKADSRVEVPFSSIIPPADQWWNLDSRESVEVPLGRAGAKKFQYMRLGKGTSQHVLISGKTGSGKSTLLNAMITNLAIHYSPDELQFYLIDFKKGVEFKAYAACRLPHARVIAIESEREFGLSVLERLDLELKNRGDLLRKFGVQDLKGFRNANPTEKMSRILLIIDEFQEFFTSDDKISHDASLLLDRLVRQGRAFGIHVLLGSQTLAGAYSLARSTIGQMAVRIALQCSESDAHLILSEDNTAARLLNRPGEAIYNDANGLFEGNHPFQVVWLSDHQREDYLRQVARKAEESKITLSTPIVFEGNVAADARDNDLLRVALEPPARTRRESPSAWLGAAVAIKDPTEAVFHRQGGRNVLIVGQQEELALGILSASLISLAAQASRSLSRGSNGDEAVASDSPNVLHRFYVLDGSRPDAAESVVWRDMRQQLPLDLEIVGSREVAVALGCIADEVERRMTTGESNGEPIFLFVYNLARFRDLKKSEDFGLTRFDDDNKPSAEKQFATILREGPSLGIHTLVWCDSFANVGRWLDRQSLRDFEMRVLFQMSAADSSNLMDNPAASRLGAHMALFYSEEAGQFEKFRPYGLPSRDWLAWVREQLSKRTPPEQTPDDAPSLSTDSF